MPIKEKWYLNLELRLHTISSLLVVLFFSGCISQEYDDYGLDIIVLDISKTNMSILANGVYSKTPVSASCSINGITYKATVSYAGATVIDNYKKSYQIILNAPYNGRKLYRLNAMNGDPSGLKALLSHRAYKNAGFELPELEPISVWLNGSFLGMFLLQEPYDEQFFVNKNQQPVSIYKAKKKLATLKDSANLSHGFSVKLGSKQRDDLRQLVHSIANVHEDEASLLRLIDKDNFLLYMAVSAIIDNTDGIINNYHLVRMASSDYFSIFPWDLDLTFRRQIKTIESPTFFKSNELLNYMATSKSFSSQYTQALIEVFSVLNSNFMIQLTDEISSAIEAAYINDPVLGSGHIPLKDHVETLKEHFRLQEIILLNFIEEFNFDSEV